MIEAPILTDLGFILGGATAVVLFARFVHIPSIVSYILAGLILGPALGLVEVTDTLHVIAEVGIVLLLFLVGLELSIEKIRDVGGIALAAGAAQMAVTGGAVAGIAWAFGLTGGEVLFLGVALTFSSTVVVVKLLDQIRALDARHGRLAVGILLVQDLVVVVVLTFTAGLTGGVELQALQVVQDVVIAFLGMGVLLAVASALAVWVFPHLFTWASSRQETLFIWSLAWCFTMVWASEAMDLSVELGAFIAGVALAQLPYSHDLRRRVHPLMNFFVAIFFVTLGIQVELGAALDAFPLVITLVVFTLLAKPPLVAHLLRGFGESPRVALRSGVTLGQTSEFSFILAGLALANGLIDERLLSIVAAVGLLTMGISSFSVLRGDRFVEWLGRRGAGRILTGGDLRTGPADGDQNGKHPPPHIIVVGLNTLGRSLTDQLVEAGERVIAIDTDPAKLRGLRSETLLGNAEYMSVLEEAGIRDASLLVSALRIEDVNLLLAYRARQFGIPSVIHTDDDALEGELEGLGVACVLNSRAAGVDRIARELQQEGVFGP